MTGRILLVAVVLLGVTPAGANPEDPILVSLFPADEARVRSQDATLLRAVYDRDLYESLSWFDLYDATNAPVPGDSFTCGPEGDLQGRSAVCFEPHAPLSEARSPYRAETLVHARPETYGTRTEWRFWVDDTAPAPPVVSSPTGGIVTDQPVVVRGTAEAGATILVIEDGDLIAQDRAANPGGAFDVFLPYPYEDGVTHTFEVFARDQAGNVSAAAGPFTIYHDSLVQLPVILEPAEGAFLNTTSVVVRGTAKPGSTVTVREAAVPIGTATTSAQGNWTTTISFAPGTHTIDATAFDGVMTDGPSIARAFTVDVTAPAAPVIVTPGAGQVVATSNVTVSGTAEPHATVRIREGTLLRAQTPVDASGSWSAVVPFVDGPHTITAAAVDRAGNVGPTASRSFSVDTAEPPIPVILTPPEDAFVNTTSVFVSGNAEPSTTIAIREGTVTLGTTTTNLSGGFTLSLPFADGAHTITAHAIDGGGNESARSALRSFTVDTVAPLAPVITEPLEASTVGTTVLVRGTAEDGVDVEVFEGMALLAATAADGEGNWEAEITFAAGSHTIVARARDLAGNLSPFSAPRTFTVATGPADVTPPAVPVLIDPIEGSVQPTFVVFRGTAEPGSTVTIREGLAVLATGTANAGQFHFGTTMPAGAATVTATATDPSGNESAATLGRNFTVDAARPTVTILTPDLTVFLPIDSVLIDGTATDDAAVVAVEVDYLNLLTGARTTGYASACVPCPAGSVSWEATPALGPGLYEVTARAVDVAGNRSRAASITIVVLTP